MHRFLQLPEVPWWHLFVESYTWIYLGLDFKLCSGSRIFPINRLGIIFQTFANWNEFHCCMFSLDSRLFTLVHFHHFLGSHLLVHALFYYTAGFQKYLMTHARFPGD